MKKNDKTNNIQISGRFEWIFNNEELRIVILKGKEYFYSKDVGKLLGIADKTRKNHVTNMKNNKKLKITNEMLSNSESLSKGLQNIKLNNAGEYFITESGLFELILKSRKPEALEFQEWLVEDVLPSLRKNNYYIDKENIGNTQLDNLQKELDTLRKEKDVYIQDSNFYSIRDIRELLGGSIEIDTDKLKEMSCKLGLSIKQEEGYFNSKPICYNRYHFLVWFGAYRDIFEITSDEKLRIKNAYDELNKVKEG